MKKTLFLTLFLSPLIGFAQSEPESPDTVKVIDKADRVTVSRTGQTTRIEVQTPSDLGKASFSYDVTVEEQDGFEPAIDFELPLGLDRKKQEKAPRRLRTSMYILGHGYFGQRFNYSDKGHVKNSFEVGFRDVVGIRWSHGPYTPSFSVGLGMGANYYAAERGFMYAKDGSNLALVPVPEGSKVGSTYLAVLNFQVPLLFTLPIGRDVEIVAGAVGCFNTYARAQTELDFGDYKTTTKYKGLNPRLFTAELTATVGLWDTIGVYASWSPMTVFKAPYGPQLKSWSIGVTINF